MPRFFAAGTRMALACVLVAACVLSHPAAAGAPAYKVVSVDGEGAARKLAVRIETRMTEQALKDFAAAIAAKPKAGERIAVLNFYLPGSELVQDAWATARIDDGNVHVNVSGLRAEEEAAFRAEAESDTREIVGVWLTSPPALPGKLTILRAQKGRFIAEWHLRSGQKTTDEVTMARVSRGYRYDVVGGDGAYYLATWGGPLQLGDATRTIALAEKLVVEKRAAAPAAAKKDAPKLAQGSGSATAADVSAGKQTAAATMAAPAPQAAVAETARVRRSVKAPAREKHRSSVADLMGGSLAR